MSGVPSEENPWSAMWRGISSQFMHLVGVEVHSQHMHEMAPVSAIADAVEADGIQPPHASLITHTNEDDGSLGDDTPESDSTANSSKLDRLSKNGETRSVNIDSTATARLSQNSITIEAQDDRSHIKERAEQIAQRAARAATHAILGTHARILCSAMMDAESDIERVRMALMNTRDQYREQMSVWSEKNLKLRTAIARYAQLPHMTQRSKRRCAPC